MLKLILRGNKLVRGVDKGWSSVLGKSMNYSVPGIDVRGICSDLTLVWNRLKDVGLLLETQSFCFSIRKRAGKRALPSGLT